MNIGPSSPPATRGSNDRTSYRQLGTTLPMNHEDGRLDSTFGTLHHHSGEAGCCYTRPRLGTTTGSCGPNASPALSRLHAFFVKGGPDS